MKMKPYFSLIIPVAPGRRAEVLRSIGKLDFPKSQYEVIVEGGLNPSRNRNAGAKKARGKVLVFIDDDAIVPGNLLTQADFTFRMNGGADILGGPQLTPPDDKWFAKANGEVLASMFGTMKMSRRYRQADYDYDADEQSLTSANLFVRKEAFKSIGGFNESMFPGEDTEFLRRAKDAGKMVVYSPNVFVYHRRRETLRGYIKQIFRYGETRIKTGNKLNPLMLAPALFVLYNCLLGLGIFFPSFLFPLYAYWATAFIFSIGKINKSLIYPIVLPFIYFLTHFAYGAGMIWSMFE